ncbi:Splicing factor 1 [Balamuthia mandrillaris]
MAAPTPLQQRLKELANKPLPPGAKTEFSRASLPPSFQQQAATISSSSSSTSSNSSFSSRHSFSHHNNNNNHHSHGFSNGDYYNNSSSEERRSRWDRPGSKSLIPGIPHLLPSNLPKEAMDALLVRARIEEITHRLTTGQLGLDDDSVRRSPSPPPRYDAMGKRVNTREQRTKEKLALERQNLINAAMAVNPNFKPPSDYKPISLKKTMKIHVPVDKYPDYNFIGLIIGPRGDTHKQMEKKSGAKISIRGKGSQKEGQAGKNNPGDDEDLHVLITADNDKQLEIARKLIEKLLVPIDDAENEHKQLQLRKLADYNGTLRENNWRGNAGAEGGARRNFREVVCEFCGEPSHPTSDCPMRSQPGAKSKLDMEYDSFLSAIGEAPPSGGSASAGDAEDPEATYAEFMASIGQE